MRFAHVVLENWRNFTRVDVPLQTRAFLVGPNASGKSNFLDAFRFLHDLVSPGGGFEPAVSRRGGVSRIRCLAAKQYSDIAVEVTLGNGDTRWRYRLVFTQDNNRRPRIKSELACKADGSPVLQRPDDLDRADTERLYQTHLEQVNANRAFRPIAEFFQSVHYYHLVPQLVRDPDRSVGRQKDDPFGGDFLEQIWGTNKKTQQSRLGRILQALKVAVPQLSELELRKDGRGVPHLYGKYEHWRAQGAWLSEVDFSDGTLRLMALLWALLDGSGPVLLEEPELSLHPEVVRHIPQMISRVQRKRLERQVLLSTHSSDLLSDEGIAADEVFMFTPMTEGIRAGTKGTKVEAGANVDEVRQLLESGLSVGELAMTRTRPPNVGQLSRFEG